MENIFLAALKNDTLTLKEYLNVSNEMNLLIEKLYVYSFLTYYSDTTDSSYKEKIRID